MTNTAKAHQRYPREYAPRENDPPKTVAAVCAAVEIVGFVYRPTTYQVKLGRINYYPESGSILMDGGGQKLTHQTLEDFRKLLFAEMNR